MKRKFLVIFTLIISFFFLFGCASYTLSTLPVLFILTASIAQAQYARYTLTCSVASIWHRHFGVQCPLFGTQRLNWVKLGGFSGWKPTCQHGD